MSFQASTHSLCFAGLPLENAVIRLEADRLELFLDEATTDDVLWHGATPKQDNLAEWMGADVAPPLEQLKR